MTSCDYYNSAYITTNDQRHLVCVCLALLNVLWSLAVASDRQWLLSCLCHWWFADVFKINFDEMNAWSVVSCYSSRENRFLKNLSTAILASISPQQLSRGLLLNLNKRRAERLQPIYDFMLLYNMSWLTYTFYLQFHLAAYCYNILL